MDAPGMGCTAIVPDAQDVLFYDKASSSSLSLGSSSASQRLGLLFGSDATADSSTGGDTDMLTSEYSNAGQGRDQCRDGE